jgi:hypothetical protein
MVATTAPMPPARHDPTSREALARAGRSEGSRPLMASVAERVLTRHGEVTSGNDALLRLLMAARRVAG